MYSIFWFGFSFYYGVYLYWDGCEGEWESGGGVY